MYLACLDVIAGREQTVRQHVERVADLCGEYAEEFDATSPSRGMYEQKLSRPYSYHS